MNKIDSYRNSQTLHNISYKLIKKVADNMSALNILDYGENILKLPFNKTTKNYKVSLFKPLSDVKVEKADLVTCIYCLEFLNPKDLDLALDQIFKLTNKKALFKILLRDKVSNYNNQKWWISKLESNWTIEFFENGNIELTIIATPRTPRKFVFPPKDTHFNKKSDRYQYFTFISSLKYLKHKRTAIDIGAHIGFYSTALAEQFSKVISFEPSTINHNCLLLNCPEADVYKIGLGDVQKTVNLEVVSDNSGNNFISDNKTNHTERINITTLDSYSFENVDLIKMDIQGYEDKALLGAINTIKKNKPIIIIELQLNSKATNRNQKAIDILENILDYKELEKIGKDSIYGPK